jgi:hypothetical protein
MAEERMALQEVSPRPRLPWLEIFRGFQVAMDPKKLLLAAVGIVAMYLGWWILGWLFYDLPGYREPNLDADYPLSKYTSKGEPEDVAERNRRNDYQVALNKYNLMHETAAPGGTLRTPFWGEDRGPNPYLLVTNQVKAPEGAERGTYVGREQDRLVPWIAKGEFLVVIEPLVKLLRPLVYLVDQRAGFWQEVYFLLVIVWTVFTWAVFGGAITRMAAVQLARKDRISMVEALRFVWARIISYFTAPLIPLIFAGVFVLLLLIFGLIHMIPWFGDIVWSGLLWPLVILAGIAMAAILVGLIGWPLMCATISAEGSDNFDALSRSYSYIYQSPWHYLWYSVVAMAYGAVLIFFVGFMASLAVYLGKWGVSRAVFAEARNPSNLFVYAPRSYHWRDLLLQDAMVDGQDVVINGEIKEDRYNKLVGNDDNYKGDDKLSFANKIGAFLVAVWVYAFFLLVLGFGYSYFWCASTIIYLLMRRKCDDTEFDEVYLEEEEPEDTYSPEAPTTAAPQVPSGPPVTMVESPTLRPSAPPAPPTPSPPVPASSVTGEAASAVVRHPSTPAPAAPPSATESSPVGGDSNPPAGDGTS